jgi:hypothetical protein
MADEKIVTKKTAAKPASIAKKAPVKPAASVTKAAKKTAPKAAAAATAAPKVERPATSASTSPVRRDEAADHPIPERIASEAAARSGPRQAAPQEAPAHDTSLRPAPLEEKPVNLQGLAGVTAEQRLRMVSEAAYYIAEKRGFAPGNDAQDWAQAEREIDELIAKARKIFGS